MKIVLNTQDVNLINFFVKISKSSKNFPKGYEDKIEIYASRVESGLFEYISDPTIDAYLISASSSYSQKAVNLIKRKSPYVPVILFGSIKSLTGVVGADIYLPYYGEENNIINFFNLVIWNAGKYLKNFATLRKLTIKMKDVIEFGQYKYDPTRRIFSFKNKEVKKLSAKEGGIMEVLAVNFGEVVKKEIILEKVWLKSDYFAGRCMDVYITHLRRFFRENKIDLTIKNISGVGLILE